jgi:hypothetical protein
MTVTTAYVAVCGFLAVPGLFSSRTCVKNFSDISLSYQRRYEDEREKVTRHA